MLTIDDKIDYKEIQHIVSAASSDKDYSIPEISVDKHYMFNNIMTKANTDSYLRIVRNNGAPIAAALFSIRQPFMFNRDAAVGLDYLYCMVKGRKAIEAIRMVHRAMVETAVDKKLKLCVSSSALPTYETFNRILSQEGWIKVGCTMLLLVDSV